MELFYYSGTGNTLHVAREIQKRVSNTKPIPIVSLLNKDKIECSCDSAGIIFPINAFSIPKAVEEFLEKVDFSKCSYVFLFLLVFVQKLFLRKLKKFLRKIILL